MTHYRSLVHTFWCDHEGCNQSYEAEGHSVDVWRFARESGWRHYGERHLCPDHAH